MKQIFGLELSNFLLFGNDAEYAEYLNVKKGILQPNSEKAEMDPILETTPG